MKLSILGIAILAVIGAACQQTPVSSTGGNANTAKSNQAVVTNSNAASNGDSMSGNMSNMAMNGNNNMSGRSGMSDTMKSSPAAANAPYDLQFLDTMSAHHQGAIEMAKMVDGKTQNPDLKKFAAKIIADQTREIAQMKEWREKWFAGKPAALNMEMSGMMDSMKMMMGDEMKKMEAATGKDFDLHFLDLMTPHHQGAVVMAKEALQKAEHPEIKGMANNIIKAQQSEIKMMNDWKAKWSK